MQTHSNACVVAVRCLVCGSHSTCHFIWAGFSALIFMTTTCVGGAKPPNPVRPPYPKHAVTVYGTGMHDMIDSTIRYSLNPGRTSSFLLTACQSSWSDMWLFHGMIDLQNEYVVVDS